MIIIFISFSFVFTVTVFILGVYYSRKTVNGEQRAVERAERVNEYFQSKINKYKEYEKNIS